MALGLGYNGLPCRCGAAVDIAQGSRLRLAYGLKW